MSTIKHRILKCVFAFALQKWYYTNMENLSMSKKEKFLAFIEKYWLYLYIAFLLLLSFICFYNLWSLPIYDWDEARHGINAFEMLKEGNYIANYYQGSPDYWNLKPPISYYTIMIGYKIFGFNAFGLRFFSALSYLLIAIIVSLFLKKKFGKFESLLCILFFCSFSYLFVMHCVRTGDADALFLLFYTISIISLFKSTDNSNWLHLSALAFALAFLTKSWHAAIIVPVIFFYLLFTKGFKKIKWWQYITILLSSIAPILLWGILRYSFDGITFFKAMFEYDLFERSTSAIENHGGGIFYYFLLLGLIPTMLLSVVCGVVIIITKIKNKEKLSNLAILCIISFITTFAIFSIAKTKLGWYIYPCVVPSAIAGTVLLSKWFKNNEKKKTNNRFRVLSLISIVFVSVFALLSAATPFVVLDLNGTEISSQHFINKLNVPQNAIVYTQNKEVLKWDQVDLLLFEFKTGEHGLEGGYEKFINTKNSYLIIDKETYQTIDKTNTQLITEDENWVFIKNITE